MQKKTTFISLHIIAPMKKLNEGASIAERATFNQMQKDVFLMPNAPIYF